MMPLAKTITVLIGAAALISVPALTPDLPWQFLQVDDAFAKNSNGNGNGNGGGNGNGNSNGNGNGNASSSRSANNGGGSGNRGNAKAVSGNGLGGFLNSVFGKRQDSKRQSVSRGGGTKSRSHRLPKAERAKLASVAVTPQAHPGGKPKNFNAKLARLNSLNRNYRALINSNSPHLAAIQAYIDSSLSYEKQSSALEELKDQLTSARDDLKDLLTEIAAYDDFAYADLTSEELEARLAALDAVDTTDLTDDERAALDAERQALTETLESDAYSNFKDAETAFQTEKDTLDALATDVSDDALTEALLSMANENRVREYGDDYVDDELLDWAKSVLGVGDEYGKIDEIREASESTSDPTDTDLRLTSTEN
ncbi:hypothetical protein CHH27_03180 [Labrenzia sp. VG12]|nr:hypothetical protein CHH27_03180 [Labrenzia sp. VG12]